MALLVALGNAVLGQASNGAYRQIHVPVTVKTKDASLITGLEASHFTLREGKQNLVVNGLISNDRPMSIGVLVDTSQSQNDVNFSNISNSLRIFLKNANPENEYFLMTFDRRQQLLLDLTNDQEKVKSQFDAISSLKTGGLTAFFDSIAAATEKLKNAKYARKAFIIFGFHGDDNSKIKFSELKRVVREADVAVYFALMATYSETVYIYRPLAILIWQICTDSGGRIFFTYSSKEMDKVLYDLADEFRNQYWIGFQYGTSAKAGWHEIDLDVTLPASLRKFGKPMVTFRRGFYLADR
jgi:Ca-activated chloride channel family protein